MPEPSGEHPTPPAPNEHATPGAKSPARDHILPRRFKPLLVWLGIAILCLTFFGLGSYFATGDLAVKLSKHITSALGFVAAVALVLMVLLLALKHWIVPNAADVGKRLAKRIIDSVTKDEVSLRESLRLSLPGLQADAASLVSAFFIGRAYWFTLAALAGILGAAITAAQLVVLIEQTEKLGKQNELITGQSELLAKQNLLVGLQTQIAAITSKADLDMAEAQRRYDEIGRILDESKSPAAQEHALLSLPDAMVMPVVMVDPDWTPSPNDTGPQLLTQYPNLRRLADRLVMFAKQPRITESVDGKQVPSGTVSTAICRALHRLGYGGKEDPQHGDCIWDIVYKSDGSPNLGQPPRSSPASMLRPVEASPSEFSFHFELYDLRHLRPRQFRTANLQNARLPFVDLRQVDLSGANLQSAELRNADLKNATLRYANMQGADLLQAHLEECDADESNLNGALLVGAKLLGASLSHARFQGADLSSAHLQGADLTSADLQGAVLDSADLRGASLVGAHLVAARLKQASLQGVRLSETHLDGSDLTGANLESGSLVLGAAMHGNVTFWTGPPAPEGVLREFRLPAASLNDCTTGKIYIIDYGRVWAEEDSESMGAAMQLRIRQAHANGTLTTAAWSTREQAESAVKSALGNDAVRLINERPSTFESAKLNGVFISQRTIDSLPVDGTDIVPAVLFREAELVKVNPDGVVVPGPRQGWFRLPNAAEFLNDHQLRFGRPSVPEPVDRQPPTLTSPYDTPK